MDLGETYDWTNPALPDSASSGATSKPSSKSLHPDDDESLLEVMKGQQRDFLNKRLKFPLPLARFVTGNLLPDEILPDFRLLGQSIFPTKEVMRGVKFYVVTFALIYGIRNYVREVRSGEEVTRTRYLHSILIRELQSSRSPFPTTLVAVQNGDRRGSHCGQLQGILLPSVPLRHPRLLRAWEAVQATGL